MQVISPRRDGRTHGHVTFQARLNLSTGDESVGEVPDGFARAPFPQSASSAMSPERAHAR